MVIRASISDPFFMWQRVRLNQRGIEVFSKANAPGRKRFLQWEKRVGTVIRMVGNRKDVVLRWDGNAKRTLSVLSASLLELCE